MFPMTSILTALALIIVGARAQGCPNNGVGVGLEQLCLNITPPKGSGPVCGDLEGFITTPGTGNQAAIKSNLNVVSDLCGSGYTNGAFTTCDGSGNVISVNPPNAGTAKCQKANIVASVCNMFWACIRDADYCFAQGSSSLGAAAIYYCCN